MDELAKVLLEVARGVRCAGLHACKEPAEVAASALVEPFAELPYSVKVGVSGDQAEAEDLAGALVAAATLVEDALPAAGFDRRSCRLSVLVTFDGAYDGVATRMAQLGWTQPRSERWLR